MGVAASYGLTCLRVHKAQGCGAPAPLPGGPRRVNIVLEATPP
jgi:hypothetical protein